MFWSLRNLDVVFDAETPLEPVLSLEIRAGVEPTASRFCNNNNESVFHNSKVHQHLSDYRAPAADRFHSTEPLLSRVYQDRRYSGPVSNLGLHFAMTAQLAAIEQEILEKFEFLPIKCRVQRAAATFSLTKEKWGNDAYSSKTKVLALLLARQNNTA